MDINEVCRGAFYQHAEAEKEKLTGQVKITLTYQSGGLTKASCEKIGPLIPGVMPKPDHDTPGKNFG